MWMSVSVQPVISFTNIHLLFHRVNNRESMLTLLIEMLPFVQHYIPFKIVQLFCYPNINLKKKIYQKPFHATV